MQPVYLADVIKYKTIEKVKKRRVAGLTTPPPPFPLSIWEYNTIKTHRNVFSRNKNRQGIY